MAGTTDGERPVSFDDREDRADAIHDRIEQWIKDLADGTDDLRTSEQFQCWLDVQVRFHHYTPNNQLLILCQVPEAPHVAGYRTWQYPRRQVQKRESAIWNWTPTEVKRCQWCGNTPSNHKRDEVEYAHYEEGNPDQWDRGVVEFRLALVFNISQTKGECLRELNSDAGGTWRLTGSEIDQAVAAIREERTDG